MKEKPEYLKGLALKAEPGPTTGKDGRQDAGAIAIIGMAGRFPGASKVSEFWENLINGVESIRFSDEETLIAAGYDAALVKDPNFVKAAAAPEGIDLFDADFFNFSPREAEITDPQHRFLLECARDALEDGGYPVGEEPVGVFAGAGASLYLMQNILPRKDLVESLGQLPLLLGNLPDHVTPKIAYKLNLTGPAVNINTACSTSLVAVHHACRSLLADECRMALAGGVTLPTSTVGGFLHRVGGILSPDGHCRSFDAQARGTVSGGGAGMVLLKRLNEAVADRDHIYAVIKGSAINNDGSEKVNYTAPAVKGQAHVIAEALTAAGVAPGTIGYVEAHGTGTPLGDPIEIAALTQAYGLRPEERATIAIGSVKSNLGHLDAAAGVTGLMKAALVVYHGKIPASLHYQSPNPNIDFDNSPFRVNAKLADWAPQAGPRRSAVSSFGIGGTNAHVVLEQAPDGEPGPSTRPWVLLPLSARDEKALDQLRNDLAAHLAVHADLSLPDVAYTLQQGRQAFACRQVYLCESGADPCTVLAARPTVTATADQAQPPLVFMFPGQDAQTRMGHGLYLGETLYREELDRCAQLLKKHLGFDLRDVLFKPGSDDRLKQTQIAQPVLFTVSYAMARTWTAWGFEPAAMIGHGLGEYVAACLTGVFELEDALTLVAARGRLMSESTPAIGEFRDILRRIHLQQPQRPFISSLSGTWIEPDQAVNPDYWIRHMGEPVRFYEGLQTIAREKPTCLFLEVGPGRTLSKLAAALSGKPPILASSPHAEGSDDGHYVFLETLARLWAAGSAPDWRRFQQEEQRGRLSLPTYPYQRRRYWIDPPAWDTTPPPRLNETGYQLYRPSWKESAIRAGTAFEQKPTEDETWLILVDELGFGDTLAELLRAQNRPVTLIRMGNDFERLDETRFSIDPTQPAQVHRVLREFQPGKIFRIVHLWNFGGANPADSFEDFQIRGLHALINLVQALSRLFVSQTIRLIYAANEIHALRGGSDHLNPAKTTALGACLVIPQEFGNIRCTSVDLPRHGPGGYRRRLALELIAEASAERPAVSLVYRAGKRWKRFYEPRSMEPDPGRAQKIRSGGHYLITGGLGTLGLVLAKHLAASSQVKLTLIGRSFFPEPENRAAWLKEHGSENTLSRRILTIRELEASGAQILVCKADVADAADMEAAFRRAEHNQGPIHGVFHAAGNLRDGLYQGIQGLKPTDWAGQFNAKIGGLLVLERLLQERSADFCLLFSSIATSLGGLGFTAYAAANCFMDAFAEGKTYDDTAWISVSWDGFHELAGQQLLTHPAAMAALDRLLAGSPWGHLIVAGADLEPRLDKWVYFKSQLRALAAQHERPRLTTPFQAPSTDTERRIAETWQELLGIQDIGIHDNFFDLGGNSLLATQLVYRIREVFGVELPLETLFDNPTSAGIAAAVTGLSGGGEQADRERSGGPISAGMADRDLPIPLSFAQQRLWFLEQLEGNDPRYDLLLTFRIHGPLRIAILARAFDEIVERHEILRTRFDENEGIPHQVIDRRSKLELAMVDLSGQPAAKLGVQSLFHEAAIRPFDLVNGPLTRVVIVKLTEAQHALVLVQHHTISDGLSMENLTVEFVTLYNAYNKNAPSPLAPLPVQYADFAVWQRDWLQGAMLQRQIDYWTTQLKGAPAALELPTRGPRPAQQSFSGGLLHFFLNATDSVALKQLAQRARTTPFTVIEALFAELLGRYGGTNDVCIGIPVANRRYPELEPMIGLFVNTLVLRNRLNADLDLMESIANAHTTNTAALAHQDLPFEKLVELINPVRDMSRSPLFQVMFNFQNTKSNELALDGLAITPWPQEQVIAKFDLTLSMFDHEETLNGVFEYNSDLFSKTLIQALHGHFINLLRRSLERPHVPMGRLTLLTEAERHLQLISWNATSRVYPLHQTVYDLFAAQLGKGPDRLALSAPDAALTYAELDVSATALAAELTRQGCGPESRVALALERRSELVTALLAIFKVNAVFVPLDHDGAEKRLSLILRDAACSLLITHTRLIHQLGPREQLPPLLLLDEPLPAAPRHSPIAGCSSIEHAAMMIYTSGTTGRPKGILIGHVALANKILSLGEDFHIRASYRHLVSAPLGFDPFTEQLMLPLAFGGTAVLIETPGKSEPQRFWEQLWSLAIDTVNLVPSVLVHLLEDQPPEKRPVRLKRLILGGEAPPPGLWPRLREARLFDRVLNFYGPTEATVDAVSFAIPQNHEGELPIGTPMTNYRVYLLGSRLELLPLRVAGEMVLAGAGLARGYWNRPGLTALRFLPNPFSRQAGARMYRSGDRARWDETGRLVFLGRVDQQIKLRGVRIEPGEIEVLLSRHRDVRTAAVVLDAANHRLIAFLLTEEKRPTATDLRAYLTTCLPDIMIPTAFIFMASLPTRPNGKIDGAALLAHAEREAADEDRAVDGPGSMEEELLTGIWAQLLKIEACDIGSDTNFFELGGHSLLVTRLTTVIRKTFGVELSLRDVFAAPTIRAQAARLLTLRGQNPTLPTLIPCDRTAPLPLSFAQQRLWFLYRLDGPGAAYNITNMLKLNGKPSVTALERAFAAVIRRHESLRTRFITAENQAVQLVTPFTGFQLTLVDLSPFKDDAAQRVATEIATRHAAHPFRLEHGPLFRALLLRFGKNRHLLLLNMHHIITDGWSIGILVDELVNAYNRFQVDPAFAPKDLPMLPIQYADFASWQRNWLQGKILEDQVGYWIRQLEGAPPVLELPRLATRPRQATLRGDFFFFDLNPQLSRAVKDLAQATNSTLFMLLETVYAELLSRYSGSNDLAVGTPVANRRLAELEPLIGFFVNTLVLRHRTHGGDSVGDRIAAVRETVLGALAHQDLPFEKLVELLNPIRDTSRSPLFQVQFTFQNAQDGPTQPRGLTLTEVPLPFFIARFELILNMSASGDRLRGCFEYDTDLFSTDMIRAKSEHFIRLLRGFTEQPQARVHRLPMLSEPELNRQLVDFNQTSDAPQPATLQRLFERQAQRMPHGTALSQEDGQLTYGELDRRANLLAHHLLQRGLVREDPVGVCLPRSMEMMIALLGVLKAGATYLPLDPTYPIERLAWILGDSGVNLVLSHGETVDLLPVMEMSFTDVVMLDEEAALIAAHTETPPYPPTVLNDLAYMIYTSGSTGLPKGVGVPHGGAANTVLCQIEGFAVTAQDRILQMAACGFDASISEIFMALLSGATLICAERERLLPGPGLTALMGAEMITHLTLTPAVLAVLNDEFPALRTLIVAGDAARPGLLAVWTTTRRAVFNAYGPTEASVCASFDRADEADPNPPIGKPLPRTQLYLLNPYLEPVPLGSSAQLAIAGTGLARGYHGQAALTASRFVPNPFSPTLGDRIYLTGDLGRWLADGRLTIAGRVDHQVKIRGIRIEPGEVETQLAQAPGVANAAVVLHQPSAAEPRLFAYVVPARQDGVLEPGDLLDFLKPRLPEAMLPSGFIQVEDLPLNVNGKLDRGALIAAHPPGPSQETTFVAPDGEVEETLAAIWGDILERDRVSVTHDFLLLGGHSLLAITMITRVNESFDVDLPLKTIFSAKTIRGLSQEVQLAQIRMADSGQVSALLEKLGDLSEAELLTMLREEDE